LVLAHGVVARIYASFDRVISLLRPEREFSNVYIEVLNTKPGVAIAIGEKYFIRAGNYLALALIFVEEERSTLVKAIATGGRRGPLDLFDLGSSRDYAVESITRMCEALRAECEVLREVDYLDASKSEVLRVT